MKNERETPRHELSGIQAIQADIEALRPIYRDQAAPTIHKQKEVDKNYQRLLRKRNIWIETGRLKA